MHEKRLTRGAQLLAQKARAAGSHTALAAKLDVTQPVVSRWLSGDRIPEGAMRTRLKRLLRIPSEAWDEPPDDEAKGPEAAE